MEGRHINELELFTVLLALRRWGSRLTGSHVRIRSDNAVTVAVLNKSTSRSANLMPMIKEIFWLSVKHNILISSAHVPGKDNVLADRISRLHCLRASLDARLLLAAFTPGIVICRGHISKESFVWLQGSWIQDSINFVKKLPTLRERHSLIPQSQHTNLN